MKKKIIFKFQKAVCNTVNIGFRSVIKMTQKKIIYSYHETKKSSYLKKNNIFVCNNTMVWQPFWLVLSAKRWQRGVGRRPILCYLGIIFRKSDIIFTDNNGVYFFINSVQQKRLDIQNIPFFVVPPYKGTPFRVAINNNIFCINIITIIKLRASFYLISNQKHVHWIKS